jgi:hypothetical protein
MALPHSIAATTERIELEDVTLDGVLQGIASGNRWYYLMESRAPQSVSTLEALVSKVRCSTIDAGAEDITSHDSWHLRRRRR